MGISEMTVTTKVVLEREKSRGEFQESPQNAFLSNPNHTFPHPAEKRRP
jgi:hypothetical protein